MLLTLSLLEFGLVSEVRVEFQLEMKACQLLCKVCEVEFFVDTLSHVARDPQLDRLLRYLFHLSATLILAISNPMRRKRDIVPQPGMLLHVADDVCFRRFAIDEISIHGKKPCPAYEQSIHRLRGHNPIGADLEYGAALAHMKLFPVGMDAD